MDSIDKGDIKQSSKIESTIFTSLNDELANQKAAIHQQKAYPWNEQPLAYTDNERLSQDSEQNSKISKDQRLASKNKKYIAILKKASRQFHQNQSKQILINKKKCQLEQLKYKIERIRQEKQKDTIKKKRQLNDHKVQLQKQINNQNIRINDLILTLNILRELNQKQITKIPQQIYDFQNYVNKQQARLRQGNTLQKVECVIQQQNILLDNLIQIQSQLIKK